MPISVVLIVEFTHTNFKTLHSSLPSSKRTKKLKYVAFVINYRHALIIDRKCINYHHYRKTAALRLMRIYQAKYSVKQSHVVPHVLFLVLSPS